MGDSGDEIEVWGIGTARGMRVHWMLEEYGLRYVWHPIRSRTGETRTPAYLAINPKGKIPAFRHGGLILSESGAIIQYIADSFPAPAGFFAPANPADRARLAEWSYFAAMELDAQALYTMRRHHYLPEIYGAAPQAVESAKAYFLTQVEAVQDRFCADGPFIMGEHFSTADILMTTCIEWAANYGIAVPPPYLAFLERATARPAHARAHARVYPDDPA